VPLHVALFFSGLGGGGTQRRLLTLCGEFARRGHRTSILVADPEGPFRSLVPPSVPVVPAVSWLHRIPGICGRKWRRVLASAPTLAEHLRREPPDVLLSGAPLPNAVAVWAARRTCPPTPVVVSVNAPLSRAGIRNGPVADGIVWRLSARWYPKAAAAIAISQGLAGQLVETAGVPPERVFTIPNPVDTARIQMLAREPIDHPWFARGAPPVILGVGKLERQKDFPTLLRSFARLRAEGRFRLAILGEGPQRDQLERLARDLAISGDVLLPGFQMNPFAWLARAAVFVLSSAWEGASNALLEALACGCPSVSTDCFSGPSETLDAGRYGPLVPVGDDRALAEAIAHVMRSPQDRARLVARAEVFSVDRAATAYLDVLSRVAAPRQAQGRCPASGASQTR
jgi:glycosyltransferase involved in cell wall biosynthesis